MGSRTWSLAGFAIALFVAGCENTFTPKGPYKDRLVVYAILSTQTDTQYVRLYTSYNPPGFDPLVNTVDNVVRGAEVTVFQDTATTDYHDTLVTRFDKTRYKDDIAAYMAFPFRAQPGESYDLTINSQTYGTVTASLTVPDRGRIQVVNKYVLKGQGDQNEDLTVFAWIRYATRGFMVRYYLDYDVFQGGGWSNRRTEMPSGVVVGAQNSTSYSYPSLQRRATVPGSPVEEQSEPVYFSRKALALKLYELNHQYLPDGIRVHGAWFVLTQVERNLYNYYGIANAFLDAHSIRMDMPNWTNINGGYGVFGAMVEDSSYVDLQTY